MVNVAIPKDRYVQIAIIVVILFVVYKILNSDIFKGIGSATSGLGEGIGTAGEGIGTGISTIATTTGEGVGTVVTSTAKIYKSYAELVSALPNKIGTWTGLLSNPENKPWLDLYENLPWSKKSVYNAPFFIPSSVVNKGLKRHSDDWLKDNVCYEIAQALNLNTRYIDDDEQRVYGAIDKLYSWYDFMAMAERWKPYTNTSLRAILDEHLDEDEKVEIAKIMNSKPLFTQ